MPRRRPAEPDAPLDRWVLSWADFMTLLFAFFVVMYAISSVNEEKYRSLSEVLAETFAVQPNPPRSGADVPQGGMGLLAGGESESDAAAVTVSPPDEGNRRQLQQLRAELQADFSNESFDGQIEVAGNDLWFSIELRSSLLFESGSAYPAIEADQILAQVAQRLKGQNNPIHVEGFTDTTPIETDLYPSNWELSAARAAAVVRMLAVNGVEPQRMAAVGYGQYQPAYSNRTAEGRQLNRRIVIVVSRDEKVRRAVSSYGSHQVSEDAVSSMLTEEPVAEPPTLEQVDTGTGVLFRQAGPRQAGPLQAGPLQAGPLQTVPEQQQE